MADTSNLTQFLTDVADSIRTKKGTTKQIPAKNFDAEILSIEAGIDTSDATATASDLAEGKTAYVNGEKITGAVPVKEVIETTAEEIEETEDAIVIVAKSPTQAVIPEKAILEANADKTVLAESIGLTCDKIVKGEVILGIEGIAEAGVIPIESADNCYIFYNDAEAKAFTGYKPGDKAIVYKVFAAPFYPTFYDKIGFNTFSSPDGTIKGTDTLLPVDTATFKREILMNDGAVVTYTNNKGNEVSAKIWIEKTNTSCVITFENVSTMAYTLTYASLDGLTYTFESLIMGTSASANKIACNENLPEMQEALLAKWSSLNILSKFLLRPNRLTIDKVYTYDVENTVGEFGFTTEDSVYAIDHQRTIFANNQILFKPTVKAYLLSKVRDYVNACFTSSQGTVIYTTDDDIVYVSDDIASIYYDVNSNKAILINTGCTVKKYVISSGDISVLSPDRQGVLTSDGSATYDLYDIEEMTCVLNYEAGTDGASDNFGQPGVYLMEDLSAEQLMKVDLLTTGSITKDISLREEELNLHGDASSLRVGNTAFINGFIDGEFEASSITIDEEAEINRKLDEIIGGA